MSEEEKIDEMTLDRFAGDKMLKSLVDKYRLLLNCETCRGNREIIAARLRSFLK
jgi:hypothetical protein